MDFLKMFAGGNFAQLEADAKAFIENTTKILSDVASSNGNVVGAVVALAEDFKTISAEIADLKVILADLRSVFGNADSTVSITTGTPSALPSSTTVAPTASPVESLSAVAARVEAQVRTLDPFAAKPLDKPAYSSEPHGGA